MDIVGAIVGLLITGIVTVFLAPALLIESPDGILLTGACWKEWKKI